MFNISEQQDQIKVLEFNPSFIIIGHCFGDCSGMIGNGMLHLL
ncbi:hypothetical protein DDB_G0268766 [Dictyostelium discoideum AX4]|uniref:Uncharacterized protein n=1 Tax=Dictyostelium discoideum TaxID=44689 RepID=Q55ES9_DICDI|nr:hypothetical protein DDB_G0268766 [Dictyostelium discoideum AX4]EAL72972.1 hypothetical protein DDB_G0268766 [Dictyostelium discoideum AX4]|eukprot:XP_646941.1 hypothetical protein DDB_G0268766 [Dictyostelium discoideum AX4]